MTRIPYQARDYQRRATNHILDVERCALYVSMGLGKTVATLTALDALYLTGESRPTLVLAPLRVAQSTWPDEVRKWEHLSRLDIVPVLGTEAERSLALRRDAPIYTMNYENLPWLHDKLGGEWPFGTVIADESTRLKNMRPSVRKKKDGGEFVRAAGGKRARALARIAHTKVKRWVNLTGTPSPNGLEDLWGQQWFVDAGARLGRTFTAFQQRWFRPSYDGYGSVPLDHAQAQIQERLRDVCLTLRAEDYLTLPPLIKNRIEVELPGKSRQLYRQMEREMFLELAGHEVEAFSAAAKTMKCLQLANGALYVDDAGKFEEVHDAKLEALESVISEAAGMPALVAYQFKSDLARLQRAFPAGRQLDSDPQTIADWNSGRVPILFAHPASAGHGLNLQDGGNIIAFFGLWWDLEQHLQIIERIGPTRQMQSGHNRPTFVHYIVARGTVDELVLDRLESKRSVQEILMEALKR